MKVFFGKQAPRLVCRRFTGKCSQRKKRRGLNPQWKPHGKYELPVENFFFNAKENHPCEQIRQLLTPSKAEVIP